MYKAYSLLRSKKWVVRSGLRYGADFVAHRDHPAIVHSEFAVVVVPDGVKFGERCGRFKATLMHRFNMAYTPSVPKYKSF